MRELKFRAWVNEHWVDWLPNYGALGEYNEVGICADGYNTESECFIEQYTGLKDKNGKEIYEGDIVSIKDNDIPFELANVLATDKWLVRFNIHRASFTIVKSTRRRNFIRTFQHIKPEDIEVIGNIHENQELLTEEE